jgi:nucleoside-diphosphate-sugar epimerase
MLLFQHPAREHVASQESCSHAPIVLVTGATGTAGRYVVPALQRSGFRVRGQYSRKPGTIPGVQWCRMNFFEHLDFHALVEGCDAVVHLAAELSEVSHMNRINVEATKILLATAQSAGARYFGQASSIVVYGSPRERWVDENTPILNPYTSIARQYHAETYMREYARTKTLAELVIRELNPRINVDLYRPAVVVGLDRILEAGEWNFARRFGAAYRRTQYIYAPDAAAAIAHLVVRGVSLNQNQPQIEAFNVCDENCNTFRGILNLAYRRTGDPRYRTRVDLPVIVDLAKDFVKYRDITLRYPLGMLILSNSKLAATGFRLPTGINSALEQALAQKHPTKV